MTDHAKEVLLDKLTEIFGKDILEDASRFPPKKMNIVSIRDQPIKIQCLILGDDKDYHLEIDQEEGVIFHDCASFLVNASNKKKACVHLLKLLLLIPPVMALTILSQFSDYTLTTEDFGSKKKSKIHLLLANQCFEDDIYVEGLNYLNRAIIDQSKCDDIIEQYLQIAIKNNLYVEFFEFLHKTKKNELQEHLSNYSEVIENGFKLFLRSISKYSVYNILKIIEYIDSLFTFIELGFLEDLIPQFEKMIASDDLNQRYFSAYIVQKHSEPLESIHPKFSKLLTQPRLESLRTDLLNYFFEEIDNFCVLEKLKMLKKQFPVLDVPKQDYHEKYSNYKEEIKQLERKVYLKKFSYLKLFMEKYGIKRTKVDFRKSRNAFVIKHDIENKNNPIYHYIIRRIGFFGLNDQRIKSTDVGINYFFIKELFSDNFNAFPDIFYYKTQFWGDIEDIEINPIEGLNLVSEYIEYGYDLDQDYSDNTETLIIEWDLVDKPKHVSIVNAFGAKIIIPDQNNPLIYDLKPFDLTYCMKTPVKIEGDLIKTMNVLKKCSFKDAITSVAQGMDFIEGFYPLSLVRMVIKKEITPFEAYESAAKNPNRSFIPNYSLFLKEFKAFLSEYIHQEREYVFNELLSAPDNYNVYQFLSIMNLSNQLSGMRLPYDQIISELIQEKLNMAQFRERFIEKTHHAIKTILEHPNIGATKVFNIKKMKNTPFFKYTDKIIALRKKEFESIKMKKFEDTYSLLEFKKTFYGENIAKILGFEHKPTINQNEFRKLKQNVEKLGLDLTITQD